MCVDVNADQRQAVTEGNGALFFFLGGRVGVSSVWVLDCVKSPQTPKRPIMCSRHGLV